MQNLYTGNLMTNPIRDQKELGSFHLHSIIDAVDRAGSPLHVHNNNGDCRDVDGDPAMANPSGIRGVYRGDLIQEKRRHLKFFYEQEQRRKIHSGNIGTFFQWEDPRKIPDEIIFLNTLYDTCIEIDKRVVF